MKRIHLIILTLVCLLISCKSSVPSSPVEKASTRSSVPSVDENSLATQSRLALGKWGPQPCTKAHDCALFQVGCCPTCQDLDENGMAIWSIEAFTRETIERHKNLCDRKKLVCAPCKKVGLNPNLIPTCQAGQCQVVDVSTSSMSACKSDEDCHLKSSSCCGCSGEPVAVSTSGIALHNQLRCAAEGNSEQCAPCKTPSYEEFTTSCSKGHCVKKVKQ